MGLTGVSTISEIGSLANKGAGTPNKLEAYRTVRFRLAVHSGDHLYDLPHGAVPQIALGL
jgi:hypothetical protein